MTYGFFVFDKKGFQNNQDKKISLDCKTKSILSVVESKCNNEELYNVVNLDKTNLDCLDKLNQCCITSFVR